MYRFDGSTVLVIKTDVTYTVTHQTTHILPPAGLQNALDESHKKPSAQQAAPRTGELARCRRAHCARFGRWRSQKHRWWPSAGVSGGDRSLTCRSRSLTQKWSFALWSLTKKHDSQVGPSPTSRADWLNEAAAAGTRGRLSGPARPLRGTRRHGSLLNTNPVDFLFVKFFLC